MFMNTKPILCIYNYHILRSTNWNNRIFLHFIGKKNLIAIGSPCVNCKTGFLHWCYRYSCIWFIIKLPQNRSRANTRVAFVVDCSTSKQSLCMNCAIQSTIYTNASQLSQHSNIDCTSAVYWKRKRIHLACSSYVVWKNKPTIDHRLKAHNLWMRNLYVGHIHVS